MKFKLKQKSLPIALQNKKKKASLEMNEIAFIYLLVNESQRIFFSRSQYREWCENESIK